MWHRESLAAFKLALDLVKAKGIASKNRDGVDLLVLHTDQISIELTLAKHERPNGLSVWRHDDVKNLRVLDVIWSDGTMPVILVYRGGAWEKLLQQQLPE